MQTQPQTIQSEKHCTGGKFSKRAESPHQLATVLDGDTSPMAMLLGQPLRRSGSMDTDTHDVASPEIASLQDDRASPEIASLQDNACLWYCINLVV